MRIRVIRTLLLALWAGWAWLGWRMIRVLPRYMAAPTGQLAFVDNEEARTFLSDGATMVSHVPAEDGPGRLRWWNLPSATCVRERPLGFTFPLRGDRELWLDRTAGDQSAVQPTIVDLTDGSTMPLPIDVDHWTGDFWSPQHDREPWIMLDGKIAVGGPYGPRKRRITVWNVLTGEMLGCLPASPEAPDAPYHFPRFAGGGTGIAVAHEAEIDGGAVPDIEVWSFPFGATPDRRITGLPNHVLETARPANGRLAMRRGLGGDDPVDVFDLNAGTYSFRYPAPADRDAKLDAYDLNRPLSPDGRFVAIDFNGAYDLDAQKWAWRNPFFKAVGFGTIGVAARETYLGSGMLARYDDWAAVRAPFLRVPERLRVETDAVRAWTTGDVSWRADSTTIRLTTNRSGADGTIDWAVDSQGRVYRDPWRIRWTLWAPLQLTFAALPALLQLRHWRRRRR